jgi:hypothetical protein
MLGGVGGVVLVILGGILLGRGGGLFLLGLLALLGGAGLVVSVLLRATEAAIDGGGREDPAGTSASHGLLNLEGVKRMSAMSQWTAGFLMGVIALVGLFLYSRADDGMFAAFGGLLFLFGLAVIIVFVHQATDYSQPVEHADAPADEGGGKLQDGQSAA